MYQECSNRHTICKGIDWFRTLFHSVRQRWKWPDRWPDGGLEMA